MRSNIRRTFILSAIFAALGSSFTVSALPEFPGSQYNNGVPDTQQVLGYKLGSRISEPAAIRQYFMTLAAQYPQQLKLVPYGESWQGRQLFYVVIGSAQNIARLDQLEQNMRRLADPVNTSEADAKALIAQQPASVWIANTLHGNELSPAESSMALAWHLLADQSEFTANILANTLVYIDPLQNPDGHHRFVSRYYATAGMEHSDDRLSAEQNEPWPNGRSNHYLFDMNRDWISLTQPENRGRVKALQGVYPLLFVDSHEMGGDMTYYFSPEAEPYNPHIQQAQREVLNWVGQNNAKWFDRFGYHYFTREIFDAFYPGYGASWPLYQGSIAMTYEMASARGHHYRRSDGTVVTFADGIQRNFVAFMATLETASQRAKPLLQRFYQYRKDAVAQGRKAKTRSYIFPASRDKAGHQRLTALLTEQGIKVTQATKAFSACGTDYQSGAYVIDSAQSTYHLLRTLLDSDVPMDQPFIKQQEALRANNLPDQIYDVTAWSLPLMFNLEMSECSRSVNVEGVAVTEQRILPGSLMRPDASYGFILPWDGMDAARFAAEALKAGVVMRSSDLPFTHQNGTRYPSGSLIIARADNNSELNQTLENLAAQSGAVLQGVDSSWHTDGPNAGSANMVRLQPVNVAMLWDEPASSLSAGSARFVLERELGQPVTAIRPAQLKHADLSRYQVLVLPASAGGSYQQALGEAGYRNIRHWTERGGVFITLGNATNFALSGETPLLASKREYKAADGPAADTKDSEEKQKEQVAGTVLNTEQYQQMLKAKQARPDWVPGFLAKAEVDQSHWLTAGLPASVNTVYVGNEIYQPLAINHGRNLLKFAGADEVKASGFVWQDNQQQIAHKPLLMWAPQGDGMVISFTQEPNYRAYVNGLHIALANAVLLAPAHSGAVR